MTYRDVYIGRLDDPKFSREGENWEIGNIPEALSPSFPVAHNLWFTVVRRIDTGVYEGRQVDWGAFVARVRQADILALIQEAYGDEETGARFSGLPHLAPQLEELRRCAHALDPTVTYALVACEL